MEIIMKKISFLVCFALIVSFLGLSFSAEPFSGYNQKEWEVLRCTNKERIARGIAPLSMFDRLQGIASVREGELGILFDQNHKRPDGRPWKTAFVEAGLDYTYAGENIASGFTSADAVVAAWMKSPLHRDNILNPDYCHLGVGASEAKYWVQSFSGDDTCKASSLSLSFPSGARLSNFDWDKSDIVVIVRCAKHGACVLPICSEMASIEPSGLTGSYNLTVRIGSLTAFERVYDAGCQAIKGDVNGDLRVTSSDAVLLKRNLARWNSPIIENNADVDGDGKVTSKDGVILSRFLAGWKNLVN